MTGILTLDATSYHEDRVADVPSLSASIAALLPVSAYWIEVEASRPRRKGRYGRGLTSAVERFRKRFVAVDESGCWLLDTARNDAGYTMFWWKDAGGRALSSAHRFSYTAFVGPIPEGLVLDHLCRNRACVNPAHLEPVTHQENILRGVGPAAINAAKTHCPNGHPYVAENMYDTANGARICRTCSREKYASSAPPPYWALRTHCGRGHELTPENTYRPIGSEHGRKCRRCHADQERRRRLERRLAA